MTPSAVPSMLEKSYVDVSFLAGMLVDRFLYYVPRYRQHRRLHAAGIEVSWSLLLNWVHHATKSLESIYEV